ncbi:SusC/RagA family TonB-linked outer membrane protein [Olivibacter domesticus]|uniref:TonB-linked outer membrane protein, SusC/RagA family n=1 Tax=Olivibacter domesticus TaxID=407022 RepID=A0A1H7Q8P1_OLID1|nr:SusC/RagA family TonB-linked outer membrane protein [Olivibacter domesticus]SEL44034.1 TonB-linked outer membrane protein, SusC/RagA family [Olivibacter domesticus]
MSVNLKKADYIRIFALGLSLFVGSIFMAYSKQPEIKLSLTKRISLSIKGETLINALKLIESKADIKFIYSKQVVDLNQVVSIEANQQPLQKIFDELLSAHNITYNVIENRIVLAQNEKNAIPQDIDIKGTVTDGKGQAIPGVSVRLKNSTKGTVTNAEGNYVLKVTNTGELEFSYMGYVTQSITINGKNIVNVQLSEDNQALNEVVVTALGISRSKKALAYSVAEVGGEQLTQAKEVNVANALVGKVAGVDVSGMATGPGGSSRVIIRGNGSLSGNNQPLYVINGMPMDNSTPGGSTSSGGMGWNIDRGDGIAGINPDDIESISVLKGGPASALYGSRAANGVILITTKKGIAQKGIGIEFNSSSTFERPSTYPEWQYEYGQGVDGKKPTTQEEAIATGRLSYGAKMDGSPYVQFDGVERPYSPVTNNPKQFYETGQTYINSLALNGGNEAVRYRASVSNTDAQAIVPNSTYKRLTTNMSVNANIGKKLHLEAVSQYNYDHGKNRPKVGYANDNAAWAVYMLANTVDIMSLAPGYDANGNEVRWNPVAEAPNSWFVVNRYENSDKKDRFIMQGNLQYDILDNLFIKGSASRDFYSSESEAIQPTGTAFRPLGSYESLKATSSETNYMLTLNYNTTFNDFSLSAMGGGNIQRNEYDLTTIAGSEFTVPYFYSYTNLNILTTTPLYQKTGINSLFGSADIGYKGLAYLTFTGRQDWFSTLSSQNNSIFYPSVGGTLVLSEALHMPKAVSGLKLRGSWAQVGGATPTAYILNETYSMVQGGHNGRPVQELTSDLVNNPGLRPLTSTTYEFGVDAQFFDGRFGADLTFYNRKTTDDIVESNISQASGYNRALLNVGELNNRGIEVLLSGKPIKTENFNWDVSYNVSYNKSEIQQLADGLDAIVVGDGVGGGSIRNVVGRPYGALWGYRKLTDQNGQTVYNAESGYAVRGPLEEIGQGVPPLIMGLNNTFSYKDFSLNVLIDGKFGGMMYSNLYQYAYRFGLPTETLPGREAGLTVTGVDQSGAAFSKTWEPKDIDTYYDNDKFYTSMFMFDNDFVKLRQVILSYNLPIEKFHWAKLQGATISLVGRNLLTLYKDKRNKYFDPESSYTNSNAQGLEAFGVPRTRSFGVNLIVKF